MPSNRLRTREYIIAAMMFPVVAPIALFAGMAAGLFGITIGAADVLYTFVNGRRR